MNDLVIIGGGTSVKEGLDMGLWDKIKHLDICTCNNAILHIPYPPKIAVWLDSTDKDPKVLEKILATPCIRVTQMNHDQNDDGRVIRFDILRLRDDTDKTVDHIDRGIKEGKLYVGGRMFTGIFAISLAIYMGYKKIYLLGFDWYKGKDGKCEWWDYQTNPKIFMHKGKAQPDVSDHDVFIGKADIINVSQKSLIPSFPKITYKKFFNLTGRKDV